MEDDMMDGTPKSANGKSKVTKVLFSLAHMRKLGKQRSGVDTMHDART